MLWIKEKRRGYSLYLLFENVGIDRTYNYIEQFIKSNHNSNELMRAIFTVLIHSLTKKII
jgi:hypothetical protein